jgi:putative CRISPR-associated protein (TIGR02619 family)
VELYHSDTPEGKQCATEIAAWVRTLGYPVQTIVIEGLTYRTQDFHRGLRSLVRHLAHRLRTVRHEGKEPVLNALGGFKSEVVYATLVGALFGVPNVYIHQGFDELLTIPPLPVGWDMAAIDPYAETLAWLQADMRTPQEAQSRLRAIPEPLRQALTEQEKDCLSLSPLGIAYYEAYIARLESATTGIYLSSKAAEAYRKMEPSVRATFDRVLQRLRDPEIRRQGSKTVEQGKSNAQIFPQGHVDERVFWYESKGLLYVLEMERHKEYEQLLRKGVFQKDYGDWEEWLPGFGRARTSSDLG